MTGAPEPVEIPDGWVLTDQWPGHGQWAPTVPPKLIADDDWRQHAPGGHISMIWWRPTPPRTVTIELPEDQAHYWAAYETGLGYACRAALEALDQGGDR